MDKQFRPLHGKPVLELGTMIAAPFASYYDQRGELVSRALGTCTRHERKAARDAGKYDDIKQSE